MKSFDDVLKRIKPFGRFQILILMIVGAYCEIADAFVQNHLAVFDGFPMQEAKCRVPNYETQQRLANETLKSDLSCNIFNLSRSGWEAIPGKKSESYELIDCPFGYNYSDPKFTETLVSRFDLVCKKGHEFTNVVTLYFVGAAVGTFVWAPIIDLIGRKPALVLSPIWITICHVALYFVPSLPALKAVSFFIGTQQRLTFPLHFMYTQEFTDIHHQFWIMLINTGFYSVGCGFTSLCAYFATTWKTNVLVVIVLHGIMVFLVVFLPECPRWQLSVGKADAAKKNIRLMIKVNQVKMSHEELAKMDSHLDEVFGVNCHKMNCFEQYSYWVLFTNGWSLAGKVLILSILQGAGLLIYFGINLNVQNFGVNPYLMFFAVSIIDVPAACLMYLGNVIGRIPLCSCSYLMSGIFAIATVFLLGWAAEWVVIIFTILTRFGCTAGWCTTFMINSEVFPTSLRSAGNGFPYLVATIIGIAVPQIIFSSTTDVKIPMVVFGAVGLTAGLLAIILPETAATPLFETVEDEKECAISLKKIKENVTVYYLRNRKRLKYTETHDPERMHYVQGWSGAEGVQNPAADLHVEETVA